MQVLQHLGIGERDHFYRNTFRPLYDVDICKYGTDEYGALRGNAQFTYMDSAPTFVPRRLLFFR